jgi:hypothetical protein
MAISSTRVKFLDKENKVLVKPIKDFTSNEIFSDFVTSILDSDLVNSILGNASLLNLQSGLTNLNNLIGDFDVSKFSINNLIKDIDFSNPALTHLGATVAAIKTMDEKTVALFMGSVLEVAGGKLLENPSLVNMYQGVTGDAKIQTLLSSLDVFSTRLTSGELTITGFTRSLKESSGGTVDLVALDGLLAAITANTKVIDLIAVLPGDPKLAQTFLDQLIKDQEVEEDEEVGIVVGEDDLVLGESTGTAYTDTLLVAYLTIKRSYFRANAYRGIEVFMDPNTIDFLGVGDTMKTQVLSYFDRRTSDSFITPVYENDALLTYLGTLFYNLRLNAKSAAPLDYTRVNGLLVFAKTLIDNALTHPYFATMDSRFAAVINAQHPSVSEVVEYIKTIVEPFDLVSGFDRNATIDALKIQLDVITNRLVKLYSDSINKTKEIEGLGTPVLYVRYMLVKLLMDSRVQTIESCYATIQVCEYLFDPIFTHTSDAQVGSLGFTAGTPMFVKESTAELNDNIENLYKALKASDIWTKAIADVPSANRAVYSSLKYFVYKAEDISDFGPTASWLADPNNVMTLKTAFEELPANVVAGPVGMVPASLDTVAFVNKAVDIELVAFSGDRVRII